MPTSIRREFQNELKVDVAFLITHDYRGVTINTFGPNMLEWSFTPMEAKILREMLEILEPSYIKVNDSE